MLAVSVDVDTTDLYRGIHGIEAATAPGLDPAWAFAVPRARAWAEALGVPLTFFVVGADLAREEVLSCVRALSAAGHAIENHSLTHPYDLVRLERHAIALEVERASVAIRIATGRAPEVFRAPGYTTSDELFAVLDELGVPFDSSVFPAPAYWLAKAAVLGGYAIAGRRSSSILGSPRVLAAPTAPYRPKGRRVFELPIQVLPGLRLPLIGTSLAVAGPTMARLLARSVARGPLVNLELHALDFLETNEAPDLAREPALRVPLARRLDAFGAFVSALERERVLLAEAGRRLA